MKYNASELRNNKRLTDFSGSLRDSVISNYVKPMSDFCRVSRKKDSQKCIFQY